MNKKQFVGLAFLLCCFQFGFAIERDVEIRNQMWSSGDKSFSVAETPQKWSDKSASVIAQLNRYEYGKVPMLVLLKYNQYNHYRIKVNDKNAVTKYSEMSFPTNRYSNATGESIKVYVGFKVVKPGGKEIIIDLATAVKMEQDNKGTSYSYKKIAIPGLEPGDIIDYYICEDAMQGTTALIHFFDPVIYKLPREYPVMNHKLQFRAERKCYINVASLNGAPELKLITDEKTDEQYYTLEVKDIDGIEDQRWLFPYRELPSIKFRAAYASGKGMRTYDVLLGEPGKAKSSVTKDEVEDMAATMLATPYDIRFLSKFVKTKLKDEKDPFEIAKQTYYFYRNNFYSSMESSTVDGGRWQGISDLTFTDAFSTFLTSKKIEHDIVIAIPRSISSIDNLLMEAEIEWLIRVKKGNEFLYLAPFDMNTIPGSISPLLEGTEAYALDVLKSKAREAKKIVLPVSSAKANQSTVEVQVDLKDVSKSKVSVTKNLTGVNKISEQYVLMDVFDCEGEERGRFEMEESITPYGYSEKKYLAVKDAYMSKRPELKKDLLKGMLEGNFDFKTESPDNFKIEQTGRYDKAEAMIYNFTFETTELVKKSGPNYLVDAGKLIEMQTKIEGAELNRKTNIYYENARSFNYKVTLDIPSGYIVQGLEKLNVKVENKWGGFTSTAKVENGKVVIESNKHYDVNFVPKEEWPKIVEFLNAAYGFTEQKILLKTK